MSKRTGWRPVAILIAVFVLGTAAGAGVMRTVMLEELRSQMGGPTATARARFRLEAMRRRLDLSDQQVAELQGILSDSEAKREQTLAPCRPQLDDLKSDVGAKIAKVLTPEQRVKYEAYLEEKREKWRSKGK